MLFDRKIKFSKGNNWNFVSNVMCLKYIIFRKHFKKYIRKLYVIIIPEAFIKPFSNFETLINSFKV